MWCGGHDETGSPPVCDVAGLMKQVHLLSVVMKQVHLLSVVDPGLFYSSSDLDSRAGQSG